MSSMAPTAAVETRQARIEELPSARVRIEDDWLTVSAEVDTPEWGTPRSLALWSRRWPGSTRLTWAGRHGTLDLCSELYLHSGDEADGMEDQDVFLEEIGLDFTSVREAFTSNLPDAVNVTEGLQFADSGELADRCVEAGWRVNSKVDGALRVELNDASSPDQAEWIATRKGLSLSVSLASSEALSPASVEAGALLLFRTSALTRLVRAVVRESADRTVPALEVRLGSDPSVEAIDRSLSALSLAVNLCGREVQALAEPTLARNYLDMAGWTTLPALQED